MKDCTCGWKAVAEQLVAAYRATKPDSIVCDCCETGDCECVCHPLKAAIEEYERKEKEK